MSSHLTILISGANGQLGQEFQKALSETDHKVLALGSAQLDVTNSTELEAHISNFNPDLFINCAAYTAVDLAESEVERCNAVNTNALHLLGTICREQGCRVLHFSTDYVFDGESNTPYNEGDETAPINIYGLSKRNGELALKATKCHSLTLRLSWLYSEFGSNFPKKMLELLSERETVNVVNDQVASPTWTQPLVALIVERLIARDDLFNGSIYHYSEKNEGSWFDIATLLNSHTTAQVLPVTSADFLTPAARPNYSKLDSSALEDKLGYSPNSWQDNLMDFLKLMKQ